MIAILRQLSRYRQTHNACMKSLVCQKLSRIFILSEHAYQDKDDPADDPCKWGKVGKMCLA